MPALLSSSTQATLSDMQFTSSNNENGSVAYDVPCAGGSTGINPKVPVFSLLQPVWAGADGGQVNDLITEGTSLCCDGLFCRILYPPCSPSMSLISGYHPCAWMCLPAWTGCSLATGIQRTRHSALCLGCSAVCGQRDDGQRLG